jgi:hypothetical protein
MARYEGKKEGGTQLTIVVANVERRLVGRGDVDHEVERDLRSNGEVCEE